MRHRSDDTVKRIIGAGLLAVFLCGGAAAAPPKADKPLASDKAKVTALQDIPLTKAVNPVADFTPDGRDATIVRAYRSNAPSPHGYTLHMVVIGDDLVNIDSREQGKSKYEDTVRDWPHNEIDKLWTVRFARGQLDGQAATFLITARREAAGSYPEPSRTRIVVHRLVHREEGNFSSPDVFEAALAFRSTARYGHADAALFCELGLPLPADSESERVKCR